MSLLSPHSELLPYAMALAAAIVTAVVAACITVAHNRRLRRYLRITNQTVAAISEELARAKEEADRLNAYRSAFIENLSRELKAPINTIQDFSESLSSGQARADDVAGYGKIIGHSALKLKQAIDDIADFSKSYSTGARLNIGDVCINELLRDIYDDFKIIVSGRAVSINMVLPLSDAESHIISDRERISKIIYHLLDNSLKYTVQGRITFGYRIVQGDRRSILISVNDTGMGIPQRRQVLLAQIFDNRTDLLNLHEKMGLGLTIAQRNARLLQGTLSFKSTLGVGSTFTLRLPLAIDDGAAGAGAVIATPKGHTVLIVEAESTSFLYLKVLLERLGTPLQLLHARTADQAAAMCRDRLPHMVLAGVNLSGNGLNAIEAIHAIAPQLPIVAVLPRGSRSEVADATAAGASDHLVKPVNRESLMQLCQKWLGATRQCRAAARRGSRSDKEATQRCGAAAAQRSNKEATMM